MSDTWRRHRVSGRRWASAYKMPKVTHTSAGVGVNRTRWLRLLVPTTLSADARGAIKLYLSKPYLGPHLTLSRPISNKTWRTPAGPS